MVRSPSILFESEMNLPDASGPRKEEEEGKRESSRKREFKRERAGERESSRERERVQERETKLMLCWLKKAWTTRVGVSSVRHTTVLSFSSLRNSKLMG